jgi:hypothetical protein
MCLFRRRRMGLQARLFRSATGRETHPTKFCNIQRFGLCNDVYTNGHDQPQSGSVIQKQLRRSWLDATSGEILTTR